MEVQKFWTKGKIIFLLILLIIVASIVSTIVIKNNSLKKEYIKLENQLTSNGDNYMKLEGLTLDYGEWREINIKDIFKKGLVNNKYSDDCKGYVIANASEDTDDINYKAYIKCGSVYTTNNYGKKLASSNKNTTKTQSQNDTTNPVIKLIGEEELSIGLDSTFKDPGVVATDNVDGDITAKVKVKGEVDTSIEDDYTLTYTVKDSAGNKTSVTRTVTVTKENTKTNADTTKPVISFKSDIVSTICTGEKLDISSNGLYGYTAYDDTDGDVTSLVKVTGSTGIMNNAGSYSLTYTVTDSSGNKTVENKNFNVRDCSNSNSSVTEKKIIEVTDLTVTPTTLPLSVGGTGKINVYFVPSNSTNKSLSYSSNNPSVATVDLSGNVRGISSGTAVITITSNNGISATCTINVK